MTPALESLGRRWIAAGGGWMEGMLARHESGSVHCMVSSTVMSEAWWPDLADPATLGCCLAIVRERWGKPRLHASSSGLIVWYVGDGVCTLIPGVASEAEALTAALEAVPKEQG